MELSPGFCVPSMRQISDWKVRGGFLAEVVLSCIWKSKWELLRLGLGV